LNLGKFSAYVKFDLHKVLRNTTLM